MDIATIIGLVAGLGIIIMAIMLGGDLGAFVNVPSLLIVVGGTICATLIKFPLSDVMKSFSLGAGIAFKNTQDDPQYLVDKAVELAEMVRKNGLLALESVKIDNDFFQKGVRLCTDGHKIEVIKDTITREVNLAILRQEKGENMFRGIGDMAPAFGMIGTLVGLVQMLSNMDDPKTIGPAMAVAMLTTFYGAVIANLFAIPVADKLSLKTEKDRLNLELIVESVIQLHGSQNPMALKEILSVYLPGASGGKDKKK